MRLEHDRTPEQSGTGGYLLTIYIEVIITANEAAHPPTCTPQPAHITFSKALQCYIIWKMVKAFFGRKSVIPTRTEEGGIGTITGRCGN